MIRLTQRLGNKTFFSEDACFMCAYSENYHGKFCENIGCESAEDRTCPYLRVIDRLAEYEDTGLEPQEIAKQKWIPVTERLPEAFVSVLVHMPEERPLPTVHEGYVTNQGTWYAHFFEREPFEVTHWMPLPEAPKEDA